MKDKMERPILAMPAAETAEVLAQYQRAEVILKYGSGGSTLMASDLPAKRIYSVKSDRNWIDRLDACYVGHPPASIPLLHHADIGPTRNWGYRVDEGSFRLWPAYAQGILDHENFWSPDAVLVDGQFRLACLLTVALRTGKPITVLLDDCIDRPSYHEAETIFGSPEMIGRMARFDLPPGMIPMERLRLVNDSHLCPL